MYIHICEIYATAAWRLYRYLYIWLYYTNNIHKSAYVRGFIKVGQVVRHNPARITLLCQGSCYKTFKNAEQFDLLNHNSHLE